MAKAKQKRGPIRLTPNRFGRKIQNVRKAVTDQMKRLNLTPYAVAKRAVEAGGTLSEQTVRNFVAGKTPMTSDKLAAVFAAVELEVRPKR